MPRRIQSPSSINMYKRCPRKYFLHYILKRPLKPNIHLYRGSIIHTVINRFERLTDKDLKGIDYNLFRKKLITIFKNEWEKKAENMLKLKLSRQELQAYYDESLQMLNNWFLRFVEEHQNVYSMKKIEIKLFSSDEYSVMGIIDVIRENSYGIEIIDYKTSKNPTLTDEYRLQLAIYALLYEENFKKRPDRIGIHFLKFKDGIRMIEVDDHLINRAKKEAKLIHINTASNDPAAYPCKCGGWCERDFL